MRIGIMCHSTSGGSGQIATALAMELSRLSHTVHLFARASPIACRNRLQRVVLHLVNGNQGRESTGSQLCIDWPEKESQALVAKVLLVASREGLDLLHFHYALPFAHLAEKVKDCLGAASPMVVGTLHGTDVSVHGRHPVAGPRLGRTLLRLDALTTVSASHAGLAASVFGLPELPQVIPNFVDLSQFRPRLTSPAAYRRARAGMRRRFRIAHVSNFRAIKGPHSLAHIFIGIREKLDAELWLVGDGPEIAALKDFFHTAGVENDVRFLGYIKQVAPILAQADLLLMPSLTESFCLAALEAMACGVPVLATEVGGLPEVVVHGETGLLFPPEDHQAAVQLAVQVLSDPSRHMVMREAAIRRARAYEQGHVVKLYESFYRNLQARRHRPSPLREAACASACRYLHEAEVRFPDPVLRL